MARGKANGLSVLKYLALIDGVKKRPSVGYPFRPYFYALPGAVPETGLEVIVPGTTIVNDGAISYDGRPLVKVQVDEPQYVPVLRDVIGRENCYVADVPYPRRVLLDVGKQSSIPGLKGFFDIETDSTLGFPDEKIAQAQILSISLVGSDGKEQGFLLEDSEEDMIRDFLRATERYLVLGGWFSGKFDMPYLKNRSKRLNLPFFDWRRFLHVDLVIMYRDVLQRPPSYALEAVAQKELGKGKIDVDRTRIRELYEKSPDKLLEYNLEDARLTRDLDAKLHMIDLISRVAQVSYCSVSDLIRKPFTGAKK